MVAPGTLVLDEGLRAGVIVVGIPGDQPASFEVKDSFFLQDANGQLRAADPEAAANSAASFIRVGPRRFSLTPGQGQQVRVAVRPPASLLPGEYRMHLTIANAGVQALRPDEVQKPQHPDALSLVVPIQVARGVRILYRHKVRPEGGRLESLALRREADTATVTFDVVRLGVTSLLATYQMFIRDRDGDVRDVGRDAAVGIYAEQARRHVSVQLPAAEVPEGAILCVRLVPDDPGNSGLSPAETCTD